MYGRWEAGETGKNTQHCITFAMGKVQRGRGHQKSGGNGIKGYERWKDTFETPVPPPPPSKPSRTEEARLHTADAQLVKEPFLIQCLAED